MTKLHQVIPAVDEVAKTAQNRLTEIHKLLSKEALTSGHHRSVKSRVVVYEASVATVNSSTFVDRRYRSTSS